MFGLLVPIARNCAGIWSIWRASCQTTTGRLVWAFVQGLDVGEFYDRIKARDEVAGRPATDPQVVLAVWLYATMEGIGSARAIDRLCQKHAAYRQINDTSPPKPGFQCSVRPGTSAIRAVNVALSSS